jgi:hypothetical protein
MHPRFAILLVAALLTACQPAPSLPHGPVDSSGFAGSYRKGAEWLDIGPAGDGYWISIDSPGHRDACRFAGHAVRSDQGLKIALDSWRPGASLLLQHAGNGLVDIGPADDDDAFDPSYFCRGGASLAGRYSPITPPAHRRGRIEQDGDNEIFRPCGSGQTYLLVAQPQNPAPASTSVVELSVEVAAAADPAGHAGRYTLIAPPVPADPTGDCPNAAFERK